MSIAYAQAGGYAEQALQGIKVVQTYSREKLEAGNYNKYLDRSLEAKNVQAKIMAIGASLNPFLMFTFYGYALIVGALFRIYEVKNHTG